MDKVMTSQALSHVRLQYTLQASIFKDVSSIQYIKTNFISFGFLLMNSFQSLEFIP